MANSTNKSVIMIGSGGHASVLLDILLKQKVDVIAVSSNEEVIERTIFKGIKHIKGNEGVLAYSSNDVLLVNGVGAMPGSDIRRKIHKNFTEQGYQFLTVIADDAYVSEYATLAQGVQVLSMAVIQAGATVGEASIINTKASVDHDCQLGFNNHIAPGATLSGQVVTGENVHIGTGANVIQCLEIGSNSVIGAGATLTKNLGHNQIVYPARNFICSRQ
ncbi:acetyltransferase [Thalassotalea sp. LPB0316]|uniref:acetyltransferase n=1 Tax=Thalassotalea sp. LPB0316 TaxID=2769490 RepID=UPI001867E170|nr:acetyltransferase [Thalassotalea sp. LPB0316]QOL27088.1 acetyltransferase [Thalassotalea sp. LPB0316]